MSGFYPDLRQMAHELLTEFGAAATLINPATGTGGTYNASTGLFTPTAPTTLSVTAAVFDYDQRYIDGTLIRSGDKRCLVSAIGAGTPMQGGTFQWGGKNYAIISVRPLAPALVAVMWELQVRPQ